MSFCLPPGNRVSTQACHVVDDKGYEQHETGPGKAGHKNVPVAELPDAFSAGYGDERRGASGGMQGLGQQHECYGRGHGKTGGKPGNVGKELLVQEEST